MARAIREEQSRRYPKIDGRRWELQSTHDTKTEAKQRADSIRRHLHKKARVREIPKTVRGKLSRWGVYTP